VISLLADANIEGHIDRLVARMQSDAWRNRYDVRFKGPIHEQMAAAISSARGEQALDDLREDKLMIPPADHALRRIRAESSAALVSMDGA
jgi:hypothetical protein